MLILKSIIMNVYFVLAGILLSLTLYIISFFVTQNRFRSITLALTKLTRKVGYCLSGIKEEFRGLENIPQESCIFASKHQSSLETIYYFNMFKLHTVYCYKKELLATPIWGKILTRMGGVSVDRKKGNQILLYLQQQVKAYLQDGISIVIFPEGTRVPAGTTKAFKKGIQFLYQQNNVPIVPVALNTGLIIAKKSSIAKANHIIIEFLPPILPQSLSNEDFLPTLEKMINSKTKALEAETLK